VYTQRRLVIPIGAFALAGRSAKIAIPTFRSHRRFARTGVWLAKVAAEIQSAGLPLRFANRAERKLWSSRIARCHNRKFVKPLVSLCILAAVWPPCVKGLACMALQMPPCRLGATLEKQALCVALVLASRKMRRSYK
jgi:hypothetical protein